MKAAQNPLILPTRRHYVARWYAGLAFGLAVLLGVPAQAQTWNWLTVGRNIDDFPTTGAGSVVTDRAGNTYISGAFQPNLHFPGVLPLYSIGLTAYVAKLSPTGQVLWTATVDGASGGSVGGNTRTNVLALDSAGDVLLGTTIWDSAYFGSTLVRNPSNGVSMVVAKLNGRTGAWLWATSAGGPGRSAPTAIAVGPSGDVFVAGNFIDSLRLGNQLLVNVHQPTTSQSVFVAGLGGTTGNWSFATAITSSAYYRAIVGGLQVDATNNVYLCSSYSALQPLVLDSLRVPASGGPTSNSFVAKLAPLQGWQWVLPLVNTGASRAVECQSMTWAGPGRLAVTGFYFNTLTVGTTTLQAGASPGRLARRLFVAELATSGAWRWAIDNGASIFGGVGPLTLCPHPAGGLVVAGLNVYAFGPLTLTPTTASSSADIVVAHLDSARQWRWAAQSTGFRSFGQLYFGGMAVDRAGRITVAGAVERLPNNSVLQFGPLVMADTGVFVAQLSPPPLGVGSALTGGAGPVELWPNPATGTAWVRGGRGPVVVRDALGRPVARVADGPPATDLALPLQGLPAGLYVVQRGTSAPQRLLVGR